MRVLVCGSRAFNNPELMKEVLDEYPITTVIEGEARGADELSRIYAEQRGVQVEAYPADWDRDGRQAGPIRNGRMLKEGRPDMVVGFWNGVSKGTKNMIGQAEKEGIPVRVVPYENRIALESPEKGCGAFKYTESYHGSLNE